MPSAFDVQHRAVLGGVPPRGAGPARFTRGLRAALRRQHLGLGDLIHFHATKLVARIAVLPQRGIVHDEKGQRVGIHDPHRQRMGVEEQLKAGLALEGGSGGRWRIGGHRARCSRAPRRFL